MSYVLVFLAAALFLLLVAAEVIRRRHSSFFPVEPVPAVRETPELVPTSEEHQTVAPKAIWPAFKPAYRQKVFYQTCTGKWLVARLIYSDGNGRYFIRRPRHQCIFGRTATEIRPRTWVA